ncbi:hypothetical protein [Tenacibaculum maritimum]|uniref:hypothetical protein n=1 Tax=Tenacibaculum maritimum TaxID=107401 RepID=UPI0012E5F1B7|nr:hypothetical protein [Tenacibaculum maritimum]MCD9581260.1 hypothetical protein [Tenacibaculum maritimum]MCD9635237.1 hypothetical protein [Tenacibaculum maritimum]CAA0260623.1 exported hypothetical protein [Tenacibaculum maritimum]
MKKIIILFITALTFLSCSSNDDNKTIDGENNNEVHTVKITYQNMKTGLDRIKLEGLPIQEQNNKWMPYRQDIRYDAQNDNIEFFTHWEADNNSIFLKGITPDLNSNGTLIRIISDNYTLISVVDNPMIWRWTVKAKDEGGVQGIINEAFIVFYEHTLDWEHYTQLNDHDDSFSFEIKVKLK